MRCRPRHPLAIFPPNPARGTHASTTEVPFDMPPLPPSVELHEDARGAAVVALRGELDIVTAGRVRRELIARLAGRRPSSLEIDARGLEHGDMSGMVIVHELRSGTFTQGVRGPVVGLRPELEKLLAAFPSDETLRQVEAAPPPVGVPEEVGAATLSVLRDARTQITFLGRVAAALADAVRRPRRTRFAELVRVFDAAGANALPLVALVSALTGFVIAFESVQPLARFGAQIFIADTIGIAMTRELGPIMTAIVLAGRSGTAFAAELGTMKVNEELDALETMGLDPIRFLVIQRIVASTALTPILTAYSIAAGIAGGAIVMRAIGFSPGVIWNELITSIHASDVAFGIGKALVFGSLVAGIGCLRGLETGQGGSAVGRSATRAVVAGIVLIILVDALFSVVAYVLRI
jgi:phospholipid/cholesterol/gamma-HCH transport system permease protein